MEKGKWEEDPIPIQGKAALMWPEQSPDVWTMYVFMFRTLRFLNGHTYRHCCK